MEDQSKPSILTPILLAVAGTAIVVSGVFVGLSRLTKPETVEAPTPTPAPVATPTPVRRQSAIAGQQAFREFKDAVATLSAAVAGFSPQDPSLTPPTLVLPLGFSPQ